MSTAASQQQQCTNGNNVGSGTTMPTPTKTGVYVTSATAAADASAMPPPPPATPGSMRASTSASPSSAAAQPSVVASNNTAATVATSLLSNSASAAGARTTTTSIAPPSASRVAAAVTVSSLQRAAPVAALNATVPPSSTAIHTTNRMALGTPSPLALVANNNNNSNNRAPMPAATTATVVTAGLAARKAAAVVASQQRLMTATNGQQQYVSKMVAATPIIAGQQPRPSASSVRSSAYNNPASTMATTTAATAAASQQQQQQQQQQQRVALKYQTVATSAAPAPLAQAPQMRIVVQPTSSSSIPRPSPAAATSLHHHRPNTMASAVVVGPGTTTATHRPHHHHHVSTPHQQITVAVAPPPPPPSMEPHPSVSVSASTGGGGGGSSSSSSSSSKKKSGQPLRRGKWTSEEEAYAGRLIAEFKAGLLPLTDGTTLRNFLSKLLNCDPMRISKKFVGNNCIGKQVFRRRVAEINRLTPEQMRGMRVELSELERRFFDRVAQTNRVKTPGVSTTMSAGPMMTTHVVPTNHAAYGIVGGVVNGGVGNKAAREELASELDSRPPTPPWLRPPSTYKPKGKFAERMNGAGNATAATAVRAVKVALADAAPAPATAVPSAASRSASQSLPLQQPLPPPQKVSVPPPPPLVDVNVKLETEKVMGTIQRSGSSRDELAQAASGTDNNGEIPRTESALEQLARTASAAKFVEDIVNGDGALADSSSPNDKKLSRTNLQGSFEALMSMDVNSVENLLELAGSSSQSSVLLSELVNKGDHSEDVARDSTVGLKGDGGASATEKLSRRTGSSMHLSSRMESFMKSLSSANLLKSGLDSRAALGSLLNVTSSNSLFDAAEKISKQFESSTGFSQLRAEDGLANGFHNSVDDFLSLVASGDIPHQDPNMLNVPLQKVMQSQNGTAATAAGSATKGSAGKRKFSQQQLVALASRLAGGSSGANLSDMSCGGSATKRRRRK